VFTVDKKQTQKTIIDLEKLNSLNAEGCPACGHKFTLGEPVVFACGTWGSGMKYIHENEAVYDKKYDLYFDRKCYKKNIKY
jgi:hypothetical protein